ncbi:pentatricopeptide repeat-containing protein [Senna tora]|uniref:Pentatricopeptide repeat-containing protein n=1 Tax=Senna tora TaxID=362788 RepID=A0A834SV88_9FABA|nr:pentatricopeptide repeat-containing protein [Senna tora]
MFMFSRFRQACRYHFYCTIQSSYSTFPSISRDRSRSLLSRLKVERNPERILEILRSSTLTPVAHIDRICFSVAITKLTDRKHFNGIREFIEELKTTRIDLRNEDFMCHAIIWYGQAKMLDDAIRSFEQMDELGIPRSVKSLNALLIACSVCENYKEECRIFLEFPKVYGIEPNLDTYNAAVKAFCIMGSSSSAFSLLAEMDKNFVKPDATTFGNLLTGFYIEEKLEDVGKVLKVMEQYGIKPGIDTYNIRIQSLCKLKRSEEAKALVDGMMSRGVKPNSTSYCNLIHGFCKEGNYEAAKNLLVDMRTKAIRPSANCYFVLASFLIEGGDFVSAFLVSQKSIENGWVPPYSLMTKLVKGLVSISKVDDARNIVKTIKQKFKNDDLTLII